METKRFDGSKVGVTGSTIVLIIGLLALTPGRIIINPLSVHLLEKS